MIPVGLIALFKGCLSRDEPPEPRFSDDFDPMAIAYRELRSIALVNPDETTLHHEGFEVTVVPTKMQDPYLSYGGVVKFFSVKVPYQKDWDEPERRNLLQFQYYPDREGAERYQAVLWGHDSQPEVVLKGGELACDHTYGGAPIPPDSSFHFVMTAFFEVFDLFNACNPLRE